MGKLRISGKELRSLGYPEGPVISIAMNVMEKNFKHHSKESAFSLLKEVLHAPGQFVQDEVFGSIASQLIPKTREENSPLSLRESGIGFNVFGQQYIEEGALKQMQNAARLPVAEAGALMPDAHSGYGLPIGGVLATQNAVIPYGVGVDIGCRMCLSIFDISPKDLLKKESYFSRELNEATLFGSGKQFEQPHDHPILDHPLFNQLPLLKGLQNRAWKQLGTSGSGNHFVEFGIVDFEKRDETLGVEPGTYLGLLSHSGSRALGANIANHYTRIAREKRKLPGEAANLAWLSLEEEEGQEYWLAMNLAGEYASACHHTIHDKIARQLGRSPIRRVENHHNFAWKEWIDNRELIVHRKGATPAGKGVLGIIPGSMTAPGFIVRGKGEQASLCSASHGAGRKMSRTAAMKSITRKNLDEELSRHGVKLIGGGLDESPMAYKDIESVMHSQQALVDVIGKFIPKIVRMDGEPHHVKKKRGGGLMEGE